LKNIVLVPLANGFEEIEAVSIIDILRRGDVEVISVSLNTDLYVTGAHNMTIKADNSIDKVNIDTITMIVLPGGWGGTQELANNTKVQQILKTMDIENKLIGAICAAPFALDKAGVLKDKFTCYPSVETNIKATGYLKDGGNVIWDKNIITSKGPSTAMEFALEIVKKLQGDVKYLELKQGLLLC